MGINVKKLLLACICLALAAWLGCSSANQADDTASVQRAVEKHLAVRTDLNPSSLQVVVDKVSFEGDHATASVTIAARQDAKAKMQMVYHLRKTGEGWEVEPPQNGAASAHGGATPMPDAGGAGSELPPGHPAVEGGSGNGSEASELPPGHPPVSGQKPGSATQQ